MQVKKTNLWDESVASLKGVGPKIAEKLAKLGILTQGDLLLHCPYRYEDRTHLTPIRDLRAEQWALIQGEVVKVNTIKAKKKRCIVHVMDKSAVLELMFFHYHPSHLQLWKAGNMLRCYGQAKLTRQGLSMTHPEFELLDPVAPKPLASTLTPVYPTVAGLYQPGLRKIIVGMLHDYAQRYEQHEDVFAKSFSHIQELPHWIKALNTIHQPLASDNIELLLQRQHPAYQRLIMEELFAHQMSLRKLREQTHAQTALSLSMSQTTEDQFLAQLPFTLTNAQARVWGEIKQDLLTTKPMLRLVQGDVGCGKTVVAALAAWAAVNQQTQVAIMVPTEILAEQHYHYFSQLFTPQGFRCELLVSQLKAKAKRNLLENCQLGLVNIVIGTHALFQDTVQFQRLGLVIIDEQHRFGVHQRLALQSKGQSSRDPISAHQLIMTATPIPRTLAMSHYAHMDISVIDSLPPNRQPITTLVLPQTRRDEIIQRIVSVCAKGQQVYWVCTLIEESDELESQAAEQAMLLLQESLPTLKVGLVHGKMSGLEKDLIMQAFYAKEMHILVATTVIEVGVNVPNATLMVIENPERLGLAQLHQLRGRVGRGEAASFCVLLYQGPLSEMAQSRLRIMRESQDGFVIAQADLELRGPGELLGTKQTGAVQFRVADFQRDADLIQLLAKTSKDLLSDQHTEKIIQRWCHGRHYAQA